MKKTVVLAGGSGFLGKALAEFLIDNDYEVVILSRNPSISQDGIQQIYWDGVHLDDWMEVIDGSYAVINFTGKSVNCIYTNKNKQEILSSRLSSVKALQAAIHNCEKPPQVFVQTGSLAIFGNTRDICDEDAPHGTGFSVNVCEQWEQAFFADTFPATRQVVLRIGFALGKDGGVLEPLVKLARLNLGGTVGSGNQYISWLHIEDLNQMFLQAIENDVMTGVYNATAPHPVTNKDFMRTLRQVMGKGWAPAAPTPLVWLGAYIFMKTEPSLALTGRNCIPKKLQESGFQFRFIDLQTTLQDLIHT